MPTELELTIARQVDRLWTELEGRRVEHERLVPYVKPQDGRLPIPPAIVAAKLTNSYRHLMAMSETPWGKLVLTAKLDRLEPNGITSPDDSVSSAVWEQVWQENSLDLESKLGHRAALQDGRSHATVWPNGTWVADEGGNVIGGDGPRVTLDGSETMVVQYAEGSRRDRRAALRRWVDDEDREHLTLYRPEAIYKFRAVKRQGPEVTGEFMAGDGTFSAGGVKWERREAPGENWPLPNPLGVVPVVEIGVNRELAPGGFTVCRGEFAGETGLIDRCNLLTFLGLVVAVWMGFPLRVVLGESILRDDEGNVVPPFDAFAGGLAQLENPEAKLAEYKAADRSMLSPYDELAELAAATSTPRHYFPVHGTISNIAAETIRALEAPMHAAVNGSHKPSLGEGWEEVLRLGGLMLPAPVVLSRRASMTWADHESRSLAERADAFSKLAGAGFPVTAAAEIALRMGQDDLQRIAAEQADSALGQLITAATAPSAANGVVPVVA